MLARKAALCSSISAVKHPSELYVLAARKPERRAVCSGSSLNASGCTAPRRASCVASWVCLRVRVDRLSTAETALHLRTGIRCSPPSGDARARAQAHAWFRQDHPENLDLNRVNAAYLELSSSRASPEFAERSQAVIERIIKAVADQVGGGPCLTTLPTPYSFPDALHRRGRGRPGRRARGRRRARHRRRP